MKPQQTLPLRFHRKQGRCRRVEFGSSGHMLPQETAARRVLSLLLFWKAVPCKGNLEAHETRPNLYFGAESSGHARAGVRHRPPVRQRAGKGSADPGTSSPETSGCPKSTQGEAGRRGAETI